jgi:hypothetical protein
MKPICVLFILACAVCLSACSPNKSSNPQNPILGKWTLKQQHVIVTVDGATQLDTTLIAQGATYGTVQFNADGSYSSSAGYDPGNTSIFNKVPATSQSSVGTYSYSASNFSVMPGLSGWYSYGTGSSSTPTTSGRIVQVTSLSSSALNVHTSITIGVTTGTGAHTITQASDFYYTK